MSLIITPDGTVISVTGTSNRITVATGTTTPIIDISSSYVGQASITTLGTISTGVWGSAATPIGVASGGTNIVTYAIGDLIYASGATTLSKLADVAAGSYLRSGGVTTAPVWSTATLPNTATSGDIIYASATNVYSNLAKGSDGQVLKLASGIPSWAAVSSGLTGTTGDLISFSASNTAANIIDVAAGSYLRSGGVATLPVWSTVTLPNSATIGDLLSVSATNVYANIAAVATGSLLASAGTGTLSTWSASPTLTTSLTVPLLIGGTGTTQTLTLKTTTGVGASGADIIGLSGSNGGTEIFRGTNAGTFGIGTGATVSAFLHVIGVTEQLRLGYDATKYAAFTVSSLGALTTAATGGTSSHFSVSVNGSVRLRVDAGQGSTTLGTFASAVGPTNGLGVSGPIGAGVSSPTALLHIKAGTASASSAPLKFNSGTLLTTAEAGAIEFLTDLYYLTTTTGAKRRVIVAGTTGRSTAQTAAVASVATYTLGATDASYEVSANVLVTTSSAEAFTVTCAYTDEGNTARTQTLPFVLLAGTTAAAINFSNGAVPYEGIPIHIRCKASTAITIATTGTFTGSTYNCEGVIKQTA